MAYDRRTYAGGAIATTLTSGIDGSTLTIPIAESTGWPTGSAGDFAIVIDRGTASEEKIRIDTRSTLTLTAIASGRGYDGTSAVAHASGADVEVCLLALDLDEANAHYADTALDHHTQYLNTTRHDVEARHTFGSALGTPAAAADIGTTAAAGTGDNPAREDHVHQIGTGAIDTAAMFAAGVIDAAAIGADVVGTSEIAPLAVTAAELAADAVTTAKILDANVTLAKLAAEAWTSYVPTIGGWSLGDGTVTSSYQKTGRLVTYWGTVTAGSTTTFTLGLVVSLPFAPSTALRWVGTNGVAYDASAGVYYPCLCRVSTTSGNILSPYAITAGGAWASIDNSGLLDTAKPFDWTTGDVFEWCITYEAAA